MFEYLQNCHPERSAAESKDLRFRAFDSTNSVLSAKPLSPESEWAELFEARLANSKQDLSIQRYNTSMPRSLEEVRQIAYELPEDQRILLAESLWDSVASVEEEVDERAVEAAWGEEIKRRLDEIDSGAVQMIPGEQVRSEMLECLSPRARARLNT